MGRAQNCLLCYSECITGKWSTKKEFFGASGQLANQIAVIFIVRKILNISKTTCQKLLEDLGNPSSWNVGYCARCTNVVHEAQFLSEQLEDLQQKLSSLSLKIKTQLFQSYKKKEKAKVGHPNVSWGAIDEIRFQFSKEFSKVSRLREQTSFGVAENESNNISRTRSGNSIQLSQRKKWKASKDRLIAGQKEAPTYKEDQHVQFNGDEDSGDPNISADEEYEEAVYDDNDAPFSPYEQPSDDEASNDPEYKPSKTRSGRTTRNSTAKKSNENAIKKISTEVVVKIEQPELEEVDDPSLSVENLTEFDADCEKGKQELIAAEIAAKEADDSVEVEGNFPCTICGYKLRSALGRDAHEKRVHLGIRNPFQCTVCKKTLNKKCELEAHMKIHLPGSNIFICPKCHRKFPNKISRNAHIQSFHYGVKSPYKCTKCGRKFSRPSSLEIHLKSKHKIELAEPIADLRRKELYRQKIASGWQKNKRVPQETDKISKCTEPKCNRSFPSEATRDIHIKRFHQGVIHPYDCSTCPKKFKTLYQLNSHKCPATTVAEEKPPKPTSFSCEDCGKTYKNRTSYASHFKTTIHLKGPKPFMCEICSQTFILQKYLEDHQKLRHHEELNLTPYICPECGKKLGSEKNLKLHVKYIHTKEFNFTCEVCQMGFEYENAKVTHMRTHTGERPFKCTFCNKGFAQSFHLKSHMRVHTGEKPYKCLTCSKCFSDKPTFNRHVEMHKGILHECSLCSKKYPTRHAFRVHMKIHERKGERVTSTKSTKSWKRKTHSKRSVSDEEIDVTESASNSVDEPEPPPPFILPDPEPRQTIQPQEASTLGTDEFRDMPQLFAASMMSDCNY